MALQRKKKLAAGTKAPYPGFLGPALVATARTHRQGQNQSVVADAIDGRARKRSPNMPPMPLPSVKAALPASRSGR